MPFIPCPCCQSFLGVEGDSINSIRTDECQDAVHRAMVAVSQHIDAHPEFPKDPIHALALISHSLGDLYDRAFAYMFSDDATTPEELFDDLFRSVSDGEALVEQADDLLATVIRFCSALGDFKWKHPAGFMQKRDLTERELWE